MLNKTFQALFFIFALGLSFSSQAQVLTQTVDITWSDQPKTHQIDLKNNLLYWHFHHASYDPAQPQVPIYTTQIDLPSYGTIVTRLVNATYEPLPTQPDIDLTDIDQIQVESIVGFRQKKAVGTIYFVPIRKNPATGQYEKLIHADLQINFTAQTNPYANNARNFTTTSQLADGRIYKFGISETGVYKMDYNYLKELGLDIDNINPNNIQLLGNGGKPLPEDLATAFIDDLEENAIYIEGGADGSFDANDYILFYGVGTQNWITNPQNSCNLFQYNANPYTREATYFIKVSNNTGKRITPRPSAQGSASYTTNAYDALQHHEKDVLNLMEENFSSSPSGRVWYGESFRINRSQSIDFPFTNRIESEPIYLQSNLAVRIFSSGSAKISVNNTPVHELNSLPVTSTSGTASYAFTLATPCTSTTAAGQNIQVQMELSHSNSNAEMWLNYLSVQARCELQFNGGQMDFRDRHSVGHALAAYQIANGTNNLLVWDITNPYNVIQQGYDNTSNPIQFKAPATDLKEFVVFDPNNVHQPAKGKEIENQNLHSMTTPSEAIFVYHNTLKDEAERLAAHRRTHSNMTVTTVDVNEIYNEFGSGQPDITAIRNFCKMLYDRATSNNNFTHLLLFGIGSFDYLSLGPNRTADNNISLIPVYQTTESIHPLETYTTDDYFALLDPNEIVTYNGTSLDIAVGRLPAANLAEATILVDKIIAYDTDPKFLAPWKNELCFVADDEDTDQHFRDAESVVRRAEEQDSTYNVDKIYLDAYKQISTSGGNRYPDVQNAINKALYKGNFIIHFLGHGSDDGWTQERVFTSTEMKALSNHAKLPLFITATCSFAPHDDPSIISAGELLLHNPNGGAVSLFTTVRVVFADANERLVNHTLNVIFDQKPDGSYYTTGEVMQMAKNDAAIAPPDNSRKFALLGDPTMTLAYPKHSIKTLQIKDKNNTTLDTLKALQKVTITGEIVDYNNARVSNFNGVIYPTVFDKKDNLKTLGNDQFSSVRNFTLRKKIIFKGKATVKDGFFTFSFVVPKDINYTVGEGKISYYAKSEENIDASGHDYNVLIGGSSPNAPQDNQGPEVLVYMNTESFARGGLTNSNPNLLVKLYDENGINTVGNSIGHDLVGKLITPSGDEEEYVLNDFYESTINDYTSGTVIYPLQKLAPGLHKISVRAWDVYNNPGDGDTEFVVAESADMALRQVLNYPNPFTTRTNFQFEHNYPYQDLEVQIQIYTVSGKLVKTINHDIYAEGNTGYRVTDIPWDGLDDYGDQLGKGVYIYKVFVQAAGTGEKSKQSSEFQKLVLLK